jgi:hypothetical protein
MSGYTRQSAAQIVTGAVATATPVAAEFNQLQTAFSSSTGHTHNGTGGEGAPITVMGPAQDLIVSDVLVRPKVDNTMDLGSATFEFKDGYFDGTLYADAIDLNGGNVTSSPSLHAPLLIDRVAPTVGGTANARTVTTGLSLSLVTGLRVRAIVPVTNTGAMTLNVDGTGAITVKTITGADTPNTYIRTTVPTEFTYNGTNWIADREDEVGGPTSDTYWKRTADGFQTLFTTDINSSSSGVVTWTFPVSFIGATIFAPSGNYLSDVGPGATYTIMFSGATTAKVDFEAYSNTNTRVLVPCRLTAVGRWY